MVQRRGQLIIKYVPPGPDPMVRVQISPAPPLPVDVLNRTGRYANEFTQQNYANPALAHQLYVAVLLRKALPGGKPYTKKCLEGMSVWGKPEEISEARQQLMTRGLFKLYTNGSTLVAKLLSDR